MQKIIIEPLPTPRPKVSVRGGHPSAYYPAKYNTYIQELVLRLRALRIKEIEGLISISVIFTMTKTRTGKSPRPKGDVDNYLKGFLDALQKAGIIKNDADVVELTKIQKRFGEAGIEFQIKEWSE